MKNLSEEEIEQLTVEITKIKDVSPEIKEKVLSEYYDLLAIQEYVSQGGIAYAKEILEKAVGSHKTAELLNRLTASLQEKPFHFARKVDANQLLGLIQHESPQVIAIVLSYLPPKLAGQILCMLPQENQTAVIERIATMDKTSPEYIKEIERMLERKLSAAFVEDFTEAGGLQSAVDILNVVDRATEKHILESLFKEDTGLAEKIRKKMFVFEDLTKLDLAPSRGDKGNGCEGPCNGFEACCGGGQERLIRQHVFKNETEYPRRYGIYGKSSYERSGGCSSKL